MIKGMENFNSEIQEKILSIYEIQMGAFGGKIPGHEITEVFIKDNLPCVKLKNGDWYHYQLDSGTWY